MSTRGRLHAARSRVELISRALDQRVQRSAAYITVGGSVTSVSVAVGAAALKMPALAVAASLASATFFSCLVLFARAIVKSTSMQTDFLWHSAAYELVYAADGKSADQIITIDVVALRDGVETIPNKYLWTGDGQPTVHVRSAGHRLEDPVVREAWFYYRINLGRHLRAGDRERIVIVQHLDNSSLNAEPIISKTVTEPLGELTLRARPPKSPVPERVVKLEYESAFAIHPFDSMAEPFDQHSGMVEWRISKPKFGHTYTLRWDYAGKC